MKIGIMGAMPEEISSIYSHMTNVTTIEYGERKYHVGKIKNIDIVLVFSRWGKVAAAITAATLIMEFKIDQLIFTGVAGAVNPELNIGDVVISKDLYQHDMDARPLMPRHQIPLTDTTFLEANPKLIEIARNSSDGLFLSLSKILNHDILKTFKINNPKCVVGTIATGDEFVSHSERTGEIIKEKPETSAVEMEGAAVAQVCNDFNIPFVVIRVISDKANHESQVDFPRFVEAIAKHYSEHIVCEMISSLNVSP